MYHFTFSCSCGATQTDLISIDYSVKRFLNLKDDDFSFVCDIPIKFFIVWSVLNRFFVGESKFIFKKISIKMKYK